MQWSKLRLRVFLFVLFWMITWSLGYPSLARYNPTDLQGLSDSRSYVAMVEGTDRQLGHHQFRILIPYLARPIERLVHNKVGSWNSVQLAMLIVNGLFVAWASLLLLSIAERLFADPHAGFIAALLYLLSFNVSNLMLAGLVDSVESWAMIATVWVLLTKNWIILPFLGVVAVLGKETSFFQTAPFCVVWIAALVRSGNREWRPALATFTMITAQVATLLVVKIVFDVKTPGGIEMNLFSIGTSVRALLDRTFVYAFAWMLPLGLFRLYRIPAEWRAAASSSFAVTLAIGLYMSAGGNLARPVFNILAPVLVLSSALFICESLRGNRSVSPA